VQLTAERAGFHPVSRSVFRPPPNVDSALVSFRRLVQWGPEFAGVKRVVQAAFGHRRKTLVNALELSGVERARAARALDTMELAADIRAERLAPPEFVKLAKLLQ
jgi:16S rRNA (adenine1518-N6/adenine1519-N6)-dimethyltransferase